MKLFVRFQKIYEVQVSGLYLRTYSIDGKVLMESLMKISENRKCKHFQSRKF